MVLPKARVLAQTFLSRQGVHELHTHFYCQIQQVIPRWVEVGDSFTARVMVAKGYI